MAHKTLVGGTAYEISGGKTLVGGTGYSISGGKTLVGGTGYDVSFAFNKTLDEATWAEISEISSAGTASNYWAVGDRKAVALSGTVGSLALNGTYYCYIIGFNHNSSREGTNRIHFQFGYSGTNSRAKHLAFYDTSLIVNSTQDNSGGWKSCALRNTICPAFKATLPSDLQAVLKTVTKYSDNTGKGKNTASYVTATTEEIFVLAEYEVFGTRKYANSAEQNYQAQYAWYSAGNPTVRYRHNAQTTAASWSLRSVDVSDSGKWNIVSGGNSASWWITGGLGFAPAFCV